MRHRWPSVHVCRPFEESGGREKVHSLEPYALVPTQRLPLKASRIKIFSFKELFLDMLSSR